MWRVLEAFIECKLFILLSILLLDRDSPSNAAQNLKEGHQVAGSHTKLLGWEREEGGFKIVVDFGGKVWVCFWRGGFENFDRVWGIVFSRKRVVRIFMKEIAASVVDSDNPIGHIIFTTIGGKNGEPKQAISYIAEPVLGTGSFEIVFQAVAIKKVLQCRFKEVSSLSRPNTNGNEFPLSNASIQEYVPSWKANLMEKYKRKPSRNCLRS